MPCVGLQVGLALISAVTSQGEACVERLSSARGAQERLEIWPLGRGQIALAVLDVPQTFQTKPFHSHLAINTLAYGGTCS